MSRTKLKDILRELLNEVPVFRSFMTEDTKGKRAKAVGTARRNGWTQCERPE